MDVLQLHLIISDNKYVYGDFTLEKHGVKEGPSNLDHSENIQQCTSRKFNLDCAFVYYLVQELVLSDVFRISFLRNHSRNNSIKLVLNPTKIDLIDYNWNNRVYLMVRERCELDHALSWLSTLGGAFSALGDYFPNCAETAGKISFHQLQLAIRLKDPNIAARCKLFLSLSLIQKKRFKLARNIINREYQLAKNSVVVDVRLIKMCQGIWSKFQYEYGVFRKNKKRK